MNYSTLLHRMYIARDGLGAPGYRVSTEEVLDLLIELTTLLAEDTDDAEEAISPAIPLGQD